MIQIILGRFDPQQGLAYEWEEKFSKERCPEICKVDWIKAVDLLHECAEIYDCQVPKYYFIPKKLAEGYHGQASGGEIVRLSEEAPAYVAIHEMAHIIVEQILATGRVKDADGDVVRNVQGHGPEFCGVLAYLYERLGYWPKVRHGEPGGFLQVCTRDELFDLGLLPKDEYSFESTLRRWLMKHNRYEKAVKGMNAVIKECLNTSEMPYHRIDDHHGQFHGAAIEAYWGEGDDTEYGFEDFVQAIINPCHGYMPITPPERWDEIGSMELFEKIVRKHGGVSKFCDILVEAAMEEWMMEFQDFCCYNYSHILFAEEYEALGH